MSKKKPGRPNRRARLQQRIQERSARTRTLDDDVHILTIPPWTLFERIEQREPGEETDNVRKMAPYLPFRLHHPSNLMSLAQLAQEANTSVEEVVDILWWKVEHRFMWWDEKNHMVVLTIPEEFDDGTSTELLEMSRPTGGAAG